LTGDPRLDLLARAAAGVIRSTGPAAVRHTRTYTPDNPDRIMPVVLVDRVALRELLDALDSIWPGSADRLSAG
jgi:hypothetical protein